jgi:hypothetical protein
MLTLKEQIRQAEIELSLRENSVNVLKKALHDLRNTRADCNHEWDQGIKGWEHEGRACILCGVNECFAPELKKMVDAERKFKATWVPQQKMEKL